MFFSKSKPAIPFRPSKPTAQIAPSPPPPQTAPICSLPIELIQEITSYLEPPSAASFCLSARYIYYAVGTGHLYTFLQSGGTKYTPPSKIERRKNIEILERAFPSHWYCAWCDRFHRQDKDGGPKETEKETKRDCAKFNSYLHGDGERYVLTYHHVRLAVNHALWGPAYGIPLDNLHYYNGLGTVRILRTQVPTAVWCEAKIRSGRLILHSTFKIWIPISIVKDTDWLAEVWPTLPQIVVGHRDSHDGHTGLKATLRNGKFMDRVQLCSMCATDYFVHRGTSKSPTGERQVFLVIDAHRDLGDGRNPFDASWRAHGEIGDGVPGFGGDVVRLTDFQAGDFKRAFETEEPPKEDVKDDKISESLHELHKRHERTESLLSGRLKFWEEVIQSRSAGAGNSAGHEEESDRNPQRRRDTDAAEVLGERTHAQRVADNNARIIAEGPRFTPPYGLSWEEFVGRGGMRGSDGIPLTDNERSQLTSGRGLFGG